MIFNFLDPQNIFVVADLGFLIFHGNQILLNTGIPMIWINTNVSFSHHFLKCYPKHPMAFE